MSISRSAVLVLLAGALTLGLTAACVAGRDPRPEAETLAPASSTSPTSSESGAEGPTSSVSTSPTSSAAGTSGADGPTTVDSTAGSTGSTATASTGPASTICDDVVGESFIPPTKCDGPSGNTSSEVPPNGLFSTSWFGCYFEDDGSIHEDPFDNCEFACGSQGLCPAGQDGPTCEANLRWFAADVDRYGCGGRIRVTNCDNGHAVVLVTLDRGPNCNSVEKACDAPVLDMSHDAMVYLFDGATYGGCEHQGVVVEQVDAATPLGPVRG